MTRAGIGFIAGGVAVYLLGSQTQIGWLYLLDAMLWGLVVLSAVFPWWDLRPLRVERQARPSSSSNGHQDLAAPAEDGTVEVRLTVRNRGRLARYFIKVVEDCPLEEPERRPRVFLLPRLGPRSAVSFSYTATCYRRGRYPSARAVLETSASLGLFVSRRRYDLPLNVTVYPASYEVAGMSAARESWAEEGLKARASAASEPYGSREYLYGDPLKHIHWRNTARLGQFVVKQFEDTRQGTVAVAFETRQDWGMGKETTTEYSIKIAASLARHCGDSGRRISILAGPTPLTGAEWLGAMDYLAGLTVGGAATLDELTSPAEAGQSLVAIVPARGTDVIPRLLRLAEMDRRLVVVLLEGFAPGETPQEFISQLGGGNLDLIRCSRGNLKGAIAALGRSRLPAS